MIPAAFDYIRAGSIAEAIDLLQRDPDGSKLVAGGHTLIPTLKLRLASPALLVDIRGIAEMKGIAVNEDSIRIGALTTHAELLASEPLHKALPIFRQAANLIADPQVRNRGTIGGSLANADSAADWPAVVIALKAELEIASATGSRRVAARDFFVDIFSTTLGPSEVLAAIHIPCPAAGTRFTYRKIRHPASGYAVVGIAAAVRINAGVAANLSIGITGAASHAFPGDIAAEFLAGKPLSQGNIEEAARLQSAATECLSDRYASAEYRASLLGTETRRALLALAA
ncbi:xanthine dehydrogenase family protein subunit M [Bradyrhizobium sp. BRP22]|uniref:FAD binding domain-containing protein n=1 Tax=Bradyrhizobium sp. BRP22 TaxID=2793821 RepID=UPI001CD5EFAB|nr:xanthine dehydrogenase family protein subunit M [Bradyrhizobium sp. BRP22]MCA1457182.1 xanthine dehydrogenase family protein subunit M [Bradyrhizobium sp. BRP22]